MIRWPGKIPAGVVTQEMFAAVDWLPTLAAIAGASNLVPSDRPIDGVDASAFMVGNSETTVPHSDTFFGTEGGLLSVKWEIYKIIFRYTEDTLRPSNRSSRTSSRSGPCAMTSAAIRMRIPISFSPI